MPTAASSNDVGNADPVRGQVNATVKRSGVELDPGQRPIDDLVGGHAVVCKDDAVDRTLLQVHVDDRSCGDLRTRYSPAQRMASVSTLLLASSPLPTDSGASCSAVTLLSTSLAPGMLPSAKLVFS